MLQCSLGGPRVVVVGQVGAAAASSHRKNALHLSRPDVPPAVAKHRGDRCLPFALHSLLPQAASLLLTQRARRRQSTGEVKSISSQVRGDGQPTNKTRGNFGSANGRARFTCWATGRKTTGPAKQHRLTCGAAVVAQAPQMPIRVSQHSVTALQHSFSLNLCNCLLLKLQHSCISSAFLWAKTEVGPNHYLMYKMTKPKRLNVILNICWCPTHF